MKHFIVTRMAYGTLPVREKVSLFSVLEDLSAPTESIWPKSMEQRKDIAQCVQINGHIHCHWKRYPLPLDNVCEADFTKGWQLGVPGFYRFTVKIDKPADTFLDFTGWGKGAAFVNGFNVGRFWEVGPQKRLYIPAPLLKTGENEIILFETEGKAGDSITLPCRIYCTPGA